MIKWAIDAIIIVWMKSFHFLLRLQPNPYGNISWDPTLQSEMGAGFHLDFNWM